MSKNCLPTLMNKTFVEANTLEQDLRNLAAQRCRLAELEKDYQALLADFEHIHRALITDIALSHRAVKVSEDDIRSLARAKFTSEGNKDVCPGIKVKLFRRCCYDPSKVIEYLITSEHRDDFLGFNKRKFDQYALKLSEIKMNLPFVSIELEPIIHISQNLEKALEE